MRFEGTFGYRLLSGNEIEFYSASDADWWLPRPIQVRFALETGAFEVVLGTMMDVDPIIVFGVRLRFETDPFERVVDPWEVGMPYYGWRVDVDLLDDPAYVLEQRLKYWSEADDTGYAECDETSRFRLPDGREYDFTASWASKGAWSDGIADDFSCYANIIPAMIACVADEPIQVQTWQPAIEAFLEHGTRLAWLFDRSTKQVHEYRAGNAVRVLDNPPELIGDPVLPGLRLRTSWIL